MSGEFREHRVAVVAAVEGDEVGRSLVDDRAKLAVCVLAADRLRQPLA